MSRIVVRWLAEDGVVQTGDIRALAEGRQCGSWVWVDVTDPDAETLALLEHDCDLHPLAIEDALHSQSRAKLDIYPTGLFLVWLAPYRRDGDGVSVRELDCFVGAKYLITLHREQLEAVDVVAAQETRTLRAGPDWTLHAIIDILVDSVLPLVDEIGEALDSIEDRMLDNPRQHELRSLHQVRRQLVKLHRIVGPERDVVRGVGRERDVVSEDAYRYFLDVGDHLARVQDSIETYQDVGASVMDIYLSAQNNRMNEIMKQLTVVATIFMPLTLISGIYGMNLLTGMWPPPLAWWSFAAVVGGMLVIALAMAAYFRKKNWW